MHNHTNVWMARAKEEDAKDPSNLTDDQKARLRACESPEELAELAEEQGLKLSDDQLEGISGGMDRTIDCGLKDSVCWLD